MNPDATILIAGGGTGGHVFPAVAVAEALRSLARVEVVFCGTRGGLESRIVPERGFRLERLEMVPLRGGGPARAARASLVALGATVRSLPVLHRVRPRAVLSVGGYASGPISLAAALSGIPLAVLEPNVAVGLSNRILGAFAQRAYVAWDGVYRTFRMRSVRHYGVPLREGFTARPYVVGSTPRVLVMGGSQGSVALNSLVPQALARVATAKRELQVVHQVGPGREGSVREVYRHAGLPTASVVGFIDDVAREIAAADVVIARAGAATIAEITAIGRAAVLIPFPHAAGNHQAKNARALVAAGAARCVEQQGANAAPIAAALESLLADPARRIAMANASRALGRPHAAHDVAVDLLNLAGIPAAPNAINRSERSDPSRSVSSFAVKAGREL